MVLSHSQSSGNNIGRRYIVIQLGDGWQLDSHNFRFTDSAGVHFFPVDVPDDTRPEHAFPSLADVDENSLTDAESALQRFVHLSIPINSYTNPDLPSVIEQWPCVEEAHWSPNVELP